MLFAARVALPLVLLDAGLLVVLGETLPGWDSGVGIAFSVLAASVAMFGIQQMLLRNRALVAAHSENAELAVENERTRFARDLHDILGHSLTVITVKAELAQRLLDVDPERTRAELADLERLSRDALSDVRRAVEGYRELTLPGELTRARNGAGGRRDRRATAQRQRRRTDQLRELFAWAVREGVTNVLRHSQARTCTIELGSRRVEVRDDGRGIVESGSRERPARPDREGVCGRCDGVGARPPPGVRPRRGSPVTAMSDTVIRLLLADDQALVRGALSALLGLERDLEVVAEVSAGDEVAGRRA